MNCLRARDWEAKFPILRIFVCALILISRGGVGGDGGGGRELDMIEASRALPVAGLLATSAFNKNVNTDV